MSCTGDKKDQLTRRRFFGQSAALGATAMLGARCQTSGSRTNHASLKKRPNVLWLMTDEQRCDSMGIYGSPWAHMPNLDQLARQGVTFSHAVTPSPLCQPARCSLLTGMQCWDTGVWANQTKWLDYELPHLTDCFHDAGYQSATFGKQHYNTPNAAFEVQETYTLSDEVGYFAYAPEYDQADYDVVQYPPHPYAWIFGGCFPAPIERTAEYKAVDAAKRWLDGRDRNRPFFLRLSLNAPHTPVAVPAPYDTIIPEEAVQYPAQTETAPEGAPAWIAEHLSSVARGDRLTQEEIAKARRYYYGFNAFLDAMLGDLLDWMKHNGLLENTIVAFMSDHGTHIGDFNLVQKQTFYEPSVAVPYFFWYPAEITQGVVLHTPVETRTLMPTFLEFAGLPVPEDDTIAQSLAPILRTGQEPEGHPVYSTVCLSSFDMLHTDHMVMVRDGDWKLSLRFSSEHPDGFDGFMVNLTSDPYERHNLYQEPAAFTAGNQQEEACFTVQEKLTQIIRATAKT